MEDVFLMNAVSASAAFKVGNFDKGEVHGAVSRQWLARRPDEKYLSLTALLKQVKAPRDASYGEGRPARSVWDMAQGITAAAHRPHRLPDRLRARSPEVAGQGRRLGGRP
jgi:hypothetical protein